MTQLGELAIDIPRTTIKMAAPAGLFGEQWGAVFSDDERYRYVLWREWDASKPRFVVIALNPSTATEAKNDPTIRRCIAFANREQCGTFVMLNLFAFRSTEPKGLYAESDPVGPQNDAILERFLMPPTNRNVCAWGAHGVLLERDRAVLQCIPRPECFGTNKDGTPQHPLYLPGMRALISYNGRPRHGA